MVTREDIEALAARRDERGGDFVLYAAIKAALALGSDCYGWYLCEEAIKEGK